MITETKEREALGSALAEVNFTEIQKRILYILADGKPHLITDMIAQVYPDDTEASRRNLTDHVSLLRIKLRPLHHEIICELIKRRTYYRYVLLLPYLVRS